MVILDLSTKYGVSYLKRKKKKKKKKSFQLILNPPRSVPTTPVDI
ncbi:hypothetical protein VN97_g8644, partial [Penicillium thymicola]